MKRAGIREGVDGAIACAHRDVSCCDSCARANVEIIKLASMHYWIDDPTTRRYLLAIEAKRKAKTSRPTLTVVR